MHPKIENLISSVTTFMNETGDYHKLLAACKVGEDAKAIEALIASAKPTYNDARNSQVEIKYPHPLNYHPDKPNAKIPVIKAIRDATGFGLVDAKKASENALDRVDDATVVCTVTGLTRAEAFYLEHLLKTNKDCHERGVVCTKKLGV